MRNDGAVACWGDGSNGQLGNGSTSDVSRAPTTGTPGWNPVFYPRGPLENDVDSDGCEDP